MNEKNKVVLSIKNVNKRYKLNKLQTFQALFDINIEFYAGELVSIVGESGSGKSTLMNLIGGLDSNYSGEIIVDNENLRGLNDKQLDKYRKDKVGFIFQSFNLIPHLSILDNVTLALTLSNVNEKEKLERATQMLKKVGLAHELKKKPNQLSGGQRQRVAIARALINNPEIIIADEPTGALDTKTSMQILKILKEIADSGKLVIMVTHSEKVASVSSRVIEISDGRIISDHLNENYVREEIKNEDEEKIYQDVNNEIKENNKDVLEENETKIDEEDKKILENNTKSRKNKDKTSIKQNLSVWSAIRLSFHNMWASKTKNLLMAFGVAIGIGSLILMLCFSSGITDYINNTMKSYSDPTIVTISKRSDSGSKSYETFSQEEIGNLITELNTFLQEENYDFVIEDKNNAETEEERQESNVKYGFEAMTMSVGNISATIGYDFDNDLNYGDDEMMSIYYLYTTPPYYSDKNIIEGEKSTSKSGIMFTPAISQLFGEESAVGKSVKVTITYTYSSPDGTTSTQELIIYEKITGIIDTSIMSGFPIMYIDYDLFEYHYERLMESELSPNDLYIQTPNEEISNAISRYISLNHQDDLTGSIEDNLANMFNEMGSIIGTSLTIISLVSIIVAAIMILVVMYMSVTERTKEIGVLKSIGARKTDIKRIFTSESLLLGILSGIIGLVFAGILILITYVALTSFVGLAPLSFKWYYIFIALGVSIIISVLSGLYPATRAARLDPVEALRRE